MPSVPVSGIDDDTWASLLYSRLRHWAPTILPGSPRIDTIEPLAPDVWRLHLSDGGSVVAKHQFYGLLTRDEPYDMLAVEVDVLRTLRSAGCCVPVAFGFDEIGQLLLLEYLGQRTLSAVLDGADAAVWVRRVTTALQRIETQLAQNPVWRQRAVPGGRQEDLQQAWRQVEALALTGLRQWLTARQQAHRYDRLAILLHQIHQQLGRRTPRLGPIDYQPGNIVIGDNSQRLAFLELGKLGWDWTERRALQYTTPLDSLGSVAVSVERLQALAATLPNASQHAALDGHHVIFRLLMIARGVDSEAHLDLLALPLSDAPLMQAWRQQLHRVRPTCI